MLSKEETVKKLIENGIDAELKDNVVYVHGANHKKVQRILRELQYSQSFGTGPKRKMEMEV